MKPRLKPIPKKTEEEIKREKDEKEAEEILGLDSCHLTNEASLDYYEKAQINETKNEFSESDRNEMSKEILSLRNEIESLKEENAKLSRELEKEKTKSIESKKVVIQKTDESIIKELESLRLSKSSMENEILRMNAIIRTQQSTIDSFNRVYTRSNYNPNFTVRGTNINGYQEWR